MQIKGGLRDYRFSKGTWDDVGDDFIVGDVTDEDVLACLLRTDCLSTNIIVLEFDVLVRSLKQSSVCEMDVKLDFMW